ncbi:MAG: hypothetical protein AB7I50_24600, partial [Vicinamibacterales bacterium]
MRVATVIASQEVRERRERVGAPEGSQESDGVVVVEEVDARTQRMIACPVRQVVDRLEQRVLASGRTAAEGSECRNTADGHLRADLIGGVRLEVALRNLHARFVDRIGRQDQDIADGHRLVDVVQASRSRWRTELADAARVARTDVVVGIPHTQLVGAVHLMIDLAQGRHAVEGIGIDSGRHLLSQVPDLREPVVDRRDVGWRNRDDTRLIEQASFRIAEVERPVRNDRPTNTAAKLLLVHGQRGSCQRILAVEGVVAEKAVCRAIQAVGTASGHDVHIPAERSTQFSLPAACHNLKLFDGIDAKRNAAQPGRIVIGRETVNDEAVG